MASDEKVKKITSLVNNLFISKFNISVINDIVEFIEESNPTLTHPACGIAYILQYDCRDLELIIRFIAEYVPYFANGFEDRIIEHCLESRQKSIILIVAYLANYNNSFSISCINVGYDIEANLYHNLNEMRIKFNNYDIPLKKHAGLLRDWYHTKYRHAGFILWEDPVVSNLDNFIA